jgi:ABC-type dipeptide/oligopeptide/nickel transport system permease component
MNLTYLNTRILHAAITILVALVIVFLMVRLAPGDPARLMLGDTATEAQVAALREQMGLDLPLYQQCLHYFGGVLRGDFGQSIRAQRPALEYVLERLPATLQLAGLSFLLSVAIGVPIGVVSTRSVASPPFSLRRHRGSGSGSCSSRSSPCS